MLLYIHNKKEIKKGSATDEQIHKTFAHSESTS